MTFTPAQWDLIYAGIPDRFSDGFSLSKFRSQQFVSHPTLTYPLCIVTIASQGIPVDHVHLLDEVYIESRKVRIERWGQRCRARISIVIEAHSITEVERFASLFCQALYETELGINPIENKMQFRGADPPQNLPPYYNPLKKMYIQRAAVDFFVEYEFSWIKIPDLIREIEVEIDGPMSPIIYKFDKQIISYSLDVIILRS
jgi:hypothetical protein